MAELMKAYVVIEAKLEPLRKGLAKARDAVRRAVDSMQKAFKRMVAVGKKAFLGLAAAIGVATWAAAKQEKAEHLLAAALKVTGDFTEEAFQKFKDFAASIQRVTTLGDEDVLMLMQLMKSLGVTADKLEDATKQAIGLAAATGRDVKSMAMYIALAQQGEFTMLRRYIPALRKTTDETEQLGIIQEFTAKGFKLAQAETAIATGALAQMRNTIGDVIEVLGEPFLAPIKRARDAVREWVEKNEARIEGWRKKIEEVVNKVISYFANLLAIIEDEGWAVALKKIGADIERAMKITMEYIRGYAPEIGKAIAKAFNETIKITAKAMPWWVWGIAGLWGAAKLGVIAKGLGGLGAAAKAVGVAGGVTGGITAGVAGALAVPTVGGALFLGREFLREAIETHRSIIEMLTTLKQEYELSRKMDSTLIRIENNTRVDTVK